MAYTDKDPCPPRRFLYLRETASWWCGEEEEEEGKQVSLKNHTTTRDMGKKQRTIKKRQTNSFACTND